MSKREFKKASFSNKPLEFKAESFENAVPDHEDFVSLDTATPDNFRWKFNGKFVALSECRVDEFYVVMQHCKTRKRNLEYEIAKMKEEFEKALKRMEKKAEDWEKRFRIAQEGAYKFKSITVPDDITEEQLRNLKEEARK